MFAIIWLGILLNTFTGIRAALHHHHHHHHSHHPVSDDDNLGVKRINNRTRPTHENAAAFSTMSHRYILQYTPGHKDDAMHAVGASAWDLHHSNDRHNLLVVTLPRAADIIAGLEQVSGFKHMDRFEEDPVRMPMSLFASKETVPYGIGLVQANQTVFNTTTGQHVAICVIDSGIYKGHDDFAGVHILNPINTNFREDQGDYDGCSHGMHVAGTIAAVTGNGIGVSSVAHGVSLLSKRVFSGPGCGWTFASDTLEAVDQCVEEVHAVLGTDAKIVMSMSFGGGTPSPMEELGLAAHFNNGNVLSVAAAGNDGSTAHFYPASYDSVISVAAVDSSSTRAAFSQSTDQIEISAPGVDILSTVGYANPSGKITATGSTPGRMFSAQQVGGSSYGTISGPVLFTDPNDCNTRPPRNEWKGKIVHCHRGGGKSFAQKATYAVHGGASAVIISDNEGGDEELYATMGSTAIPIPMISVTQNDGVALDDLFNSPTVQISVSCPDPATTTGSGYDYMSGTSMAAPHVSAGAALVWSHSPNSSAAQVRQALTATALDLDDVGRDDRTGFGLLQVKNATDWILGLRTIDPSVTPPSFPPSAPSSSSSVTTSSPSSPPSSSPPTPTPDNQCVSQGDTCRKKKCESWSACCCSGATCEGNGSTGICQS
jgi:serine protease